MRRRDSIEFLWDELKSFLPKSYTEEESIKILSILKQAKAKHQDEIESTYDDAIMKGRHEDGVEYYKEKFGGNK